MIACISNLLNPPTIDWSEIDRLEQRICDLRRRIREAKSTQERFFPTQRIHDKKPFDLFPNKSNDATTSMGEGSTLSQSQRSYKRETKQEARLNEMNNLRAKMKPKDDLIAEEMARQDQELQDAIDRALAKKNK